MIHSRVIVLDSSGTSAVGSASCPPARYAGAYYQFSNPLQSATINIKNPTLNETLLTKSGAVNADGVQEFDNTKREPIVSGTLIADVNTISGGTPGDKLSITVYLDLGGSG